MLVWKFSTLFHTGKKWARFNPCFAGCWSGSSCLVTGCRAIEKFQSLFCWMLVWKLTAVIAFWKNIVELSFNPCFAGCWSGRWKLSHVPWKLNTFQSLFCWMLVWKFGAEQVGICALEGFNPCFAGCWSGSKGRGIHGCMNKVFQSLFCWMLVWKMSYMPPTDTMLSVSILVLLDVGLEGTDKEKEKQFEISFNPCFAGCWSGSLSRSYIRQS